MGDPTKKVLLIGVDQAIIYLIDKYVGQGKLPHVASLLDRGVRAEALPCPPCDTPTNWATIATGATTAVHGVTSFYLHVPGEPLDAGLDLRSRAQLAKNCQAEYFWTVADRHQLAPFVMNYPAGWGSEFSNGAMSLFSWQIPDTPPVILAPARTREFRREGGAEGDAGTAGKAGDASSAGQEIVAATTEVEGLESATPLLRVTLAGATSTDETLLAYLVSSGSTGNAYDALAVRDAEAGSWTRVGPGEWSPWLRARFQRGKSDHDALFKVRPERIAPDGAGATLHYSTRYNARDWTIPSRHAEGLVKHAMAPEMAHEDRKVEYMIEGGVEAYLTQARTESLTIARAIEYMRREINWRVCFFHVHYLDSVNHRTLAYLAPESPLHSTAGAADAARQVETAYQIVDEMVGKLVNTVVDDDTVVVFVADHGAVPAWKIVNIPQALARAGLMRYQYKKRRYRVQWDETRAFPYLEPPHVWVNLKGRDPHGIVPPAQYESTRDAIIEALYAIRDPDTGRRVVQLALRREEAAFLGQDGPRVGDVVYFLAPPYQVFDGEVEGLNPARVPPKFMVTPDVTPARTCFGAHAYYLPRANLGGYTVSSPLIFAGPGIREGATLRSTVDLMDVTPTLAHVMGIPRPAQAQGRVLHEIFE